VYTAMACSCWKNELSTRILNCKLPKGLSHGDGLSISLIALEAIQKYEAENGRKRNEKNL
jgi:hypothetical protein